MPFEANLDRRRVALLVAIGLAFVLIGVWMVGGFGPVEPSGRMSVGAQHVWGWIAIVFFGLGVAISVPRLFQSGVAVRVDADGVYGRRHSQQVIPWSAIDRITTVEVRRIQFARLYLNDPEGYPPEGIARWVRRATGVFGMKALGAVDISLQTTDRNLAELRVAVEHFAPGKLDRPEPA